MNSTSEERMNGSGKTLGITENKDGVQRGTKLKITVPVLSPALELVLDTVRVPCHSTHSLRNGPEHSDVHGNPLNPPKASLQSKETYLTQMHLNQCNKASQCFSTLLLKPTHM